MPRIGRLVIPNYPHHVIHRGHNRQAIFIQADDYRYYLDNLVECKDELNCRLYAYCLIMENRDRFIYPRMHRGRTKVTY